VEFPTNIELLINLKTAKALATLRHGLNTNVVLRARDAQKLALAKCAVEGMLERVRRAQSRSA
jgi:hypothetical protein